MKRVYMIALAILLLSATGFSQKGNNVIGVGGDLSFPMGDFADFYKTGFGVYSKGMLGVGKAGQVTFTAGYSAYKLISNWEEATSTIGLIPLLLGYRHNFNGFFVEPQLGYCLSSIKINSPELEGPLSKTGGILMGAAGIGYVFNKQVEISGRYQFARNNGSNLNLFGLRLGYNFSLTHSK